MSNFDDRPALRAEMHRENETGRRIAAMVDDPNSSWDDFCAGIGIAPWRIRKAVGDRVLYPDIRDAVAEFIHTNFRRSILRTEATITDIAHRYHDRVAAKRRHAA